MGAVDVLSAHDIVRAADVVAIAHQVGLDVAAAATLLQKESGGGHNVWGHDGVQTGGLYTKGGEVTRANYTAYKAHRTEFGSQGVGPCQLTWAGFQDQADELGGCWDWTCNVRIGFSNLAGLIKAHGLHDGFRRYNGTGPAAEAYADDAMARFHDWQASLGGLAGGGPTGAEVRHRTYTVVRDDTLSEIGEATGTDWHRIAAINHIPAPFIIQPGQVLRLPDR